MRVRWSGLSPEVFVELDRSAPEPVGTQLQTSLRAAIRSGRLAPGERLPSTRQLASDLGVSRGTVQDCFAQLEAEGYLVVSPGAGTAVAEVGPAASVPPRRQHPPESASSVIDFSPGRPDLDSFPMRDWMWATAEAARGMPSRSFGYGDPAGDAALRETIAAYLRRVRGAHAAAENVVVCGGFTQGAALTLAALRSQDLHSVGVEDPGHDEMRELVRRAHLEAVPVAVDEHGIDVARLSRSGATAVMLTPAHQTPTGVVLTPERRHQLLDWARERRGIVIEDDYDSEFRYDRRPVGALQGLAPSSVVLVGSTSKSLAPALRLGWTVAPAALADRIADEKRYADRGAPLLDQRALAVLMESGRYDKHLRRMRCVYAERRDALVDALSRHAPGARLSGLAAGFHAVVELRPGSDEQAVIAEAAARGVRLHGINRYRATSGGAPGIVFGFGDLTAAAIGRGIALVGDLLD